MIKHIILILLINLFSISSFANSKIIRSNNSIKREDICSQDTKDLCQNKIVNIINHSNISLVISNYNFSNQEINKSINNIIQRGIYTIIYTNSYTANKFRAVFNYYLTQKSVLIYISDIEYFKQDQIIIVDQYLIIRGHIDETLRTNRNSIIKLNNPPNYIQFMKSGTLASIFDNKFLEHISHSERYINP